MSTAREYVLTDPFILNFEFDIVSIVVIPYYSLDMSLSAISPLSSTTSVAGS